MTFLYAGKILTAIATPLTLAIAVLLLAAFSQRRNPRSFLFRATLFSTVLLMICSSGCTSQLLLESLERPYVNLTIAAAPTAEAIVVLGGYLRYESRTGRPVEIGGTADRLFCAVELYRASKAPLILLSGGNAFPTSSTPPESLVASRILQEWGISPSAILIEDRSRSTHENAVFSERLLNARGIRRILLVTSASHMRRAEATFRTTDLTVFPFAADFIAEGAPSYSLLSLLPDAQAASNSSMAIKEWLGLAVYRWRGWASTPRSSSPSDPGTRPDR